MKAIFRNASVYENGSVKKQDMFFDGFSISRFAGEVFPSDAAVIDNTLIIPGFCDAHVHLREPGFSYKETVASGSLAGAAGGYTALMTMPNLKPAPDSAEHLREQTDIIDRDAVIPVYPFGTVTVGELGETLSDMEGMAERVVGYSDDGRGVQSDDMMESAMIKAKSLGKIISAHCEVNSLLRGGYIHDGEYARAHGHKGICSESEYRQIERDIVLAERTGCPYHVCHISTKESVRIIREAKARGIDITCETGPHYLTLDDSCLLEEGRFKMNPPLRAASDREALIEGLLDGTVDMIATDHAPHSEEEKSRGLEKSLMGVVGLETAFAVLYTKLVMAGVLSIPRLVELMSINPRKRFGIKSDAGFTVFKTDEEYTVDPESFKSKGRSTPFAGMKLFGKCILTVLDRNVVYSDGI